MAIRLWPIMWLSKVALDGVQIMSMRVVLCMRKTPGGCPNWISRQGIALVRKAGWEVVSICPVVCEEFSWRVHALRWSWRCRSGLGTRQRANNSGSL